MLRFSTICLFFVVTGCAGNSGPPSASERSAARPKLADRVEFVEKYVTFRRKYDDLEYNISYRNGDSFPPSPSEWDVRIVAMVPPGDIENWTIPQKLNVAATTPEWVTDTAHAIDATSVTEWYTDGNRTVGLDRKHNVVAYRTFAY